MAMLVAIFIVLQLVFTCISKSKNTTNKETIQTTNITNNLPEFEIFYKDGTTSKIKASSVIYEQTNENIYFFGRMNDTIKILPKIIVEDVKIIE